MDPDATLDQLRSQIEDYRSLDDGTGDADRNAMLEVADQLIASVEALDRWLSNQGFLPGAWQR